MAETANLNVFGEFNDDVAAWVIANSLKHGKFDDIFGQFVQTYVMPQRQGDTAAFRRPYPLALATAPLEDGKPPAGQKLRYERIYMTLDEYGDVIKFTNRVIKLSRDPFLKDATAEMGEQIVGTFETVRGDTFKAGSNVFYAGNNVSARTNVNGVITRDLVRKVRREMKKNKASEISDRIKPSVKYGTESVSRAYFAITPWELESDIQNCAGFTDSKDYAQGDGLPTEIGSVEKIRFIGSNMLTGWTQAATNISTTAYLSNGVSPTEASNPDVFPILVLAKDALGSVGLKGENAMTPILVNPKAAHGNELGQQGFISWRTFFVCGILNEANLIRVECCASAL